MVIVNDYIGFKSHHPHHSWGLPLGASIVGDNFLQLNMGVYANGQRTLPVKQSPSGLEVRVLLHPLKGPSKTF